MAASPTSSTGKSAAVASSRFTSSARSLVANHPSSSVGTLMVKRAAAVVPGAALATTAPALLVACGADVPVPFFVGSMALLVVGATTMQPALTALQAEIAPPGRRGEALSLSRLAFDTTFVVAPLTLGFVADSVSCEAALLVAGAANAVAAGTFLALMRRRSRLDAEAVSGEPRPRAPPRAEKSES